MKNLNLLGLLLVLFISITSCKKDNPPPTTLEIKLVDNVGNPVSGASVNLYNTLSDFENNSNVISSKTSDVDGKVTFTDLNSKVYYWFASIGCLNNYNGAGFTATPLTANTNNSVTCVLTSTGTLIFTNNSSDPYQVYNNGTLMFVANPGTTYTYNYKPTANYIIRVVQVSGYVFTPTDLTFDQVTLTCGQTITFNFPN